MKPFDLQAALNGAKVITRNGREVTQLHLFESRAQQNLFGVIDGEIECWNEKGIYSFCTPGSNEDLFLAPTERKEWVVRIPSLSSAPVIVGPLNLEGAQRTAEQYTNATIHEITIIE